MIGHVAVANSSSSSSSSRTDRSFACLLAVYALHAALFHVLCLTRPPPSTNASVVVVVVVVPPKSRNENVTIFPSQQQQQQQQQQQTLLSLRPSESPSRKNSTVASAGGDRRHVTLKCGPDDSWFNWISNYSMIGGITSSTWAVVSGCAIFLLINIDRRDEQQLRNRRVALADGVFSSTFQE